MSDFPYLDMEKAIIAHIETNLGTGGTIPLVYPNAPTVDADSAETRPAAYIEVHILNGTSEQADTGTSAPRIRRPGIIQLSVFTALGKGTARSTALVDTIVGFLRRAQIIASGGKIVCEEVSPRPGLREGAYWRVDVDTRFYSDDFDS